MAVKAPVALTKSGDEIPLRSRGTRQTGLRLYNERLVLSLIRDHQNVPKAEIARLTGLSAQTVSVIVRQLERDGLVIKGSSLKGKVGQPLQPFSLNPDGAFAIGLKVGRRSGELMLVGLDGKVRKILRQPYEFPTPERFVNFAKSGMAELESDLGVTRSKLISGLGVAAPFEIWKWEKEAGATPAVLSAWKSFDLEVRLQQFFPWPVHYCNDATAACAAEFLFGRGRTLRGFAYIYCGYFVGGGIVIDGKVHQGPKGNAGALGSMLVPAGEGRASAQLITMASLFHLERLLQRSGKNPSVLWTDQYDWSKAEPEVQAWIDMAALPLAFAAANLAATLECSAVIIDGAMPDSIRARLVARTKEMLEHVNCDGITPFSIETGTRGAAARALGAASLPLVANFMIDRDVLFAGAGATG
jgi:predicted NBD/HSP70 family sugar kinase/biotin operon repressor